MKIKFGVEVGDERAEIRVEELVQRFIRQFPTSLVDRDKGNANVQAQLDHAAELGVPDVILEGYIMRFNREVFVSVSEVHWHGAIATTYLHTIEPELGDAILFEIVSADTAAMVELIVKELGTDLGLVSRKKFS